MDPYVRTEHNYLTYIIVFFSSFDSGVHSLPHSNKLMGLITCIRCVVLLQLPPPVQRHACVGMVNLNEPYWMKMSVSVCHFDVLGTVQGARAKQRR